VALLLLVTPLANEAQQLGKMPRVGVLTAGSAGEALDAAFFDRMRELAISKADGHLRRRFAAGRIQDLPAPPNNFVTTRARTSSSLPSLAAALAARKATPAIPIVFAVSADPVGAGLVASLRQPGGNVTGLMSMNTELAPKRLELLKEIAPQISRVALFLNPDNVPDGNS